MKRRVFITISLLLLIVSGFIFLRKPKPSMGGDVVKQLLVSEILPGKGAGVIIGNKVSIHYTAWRWDGTMFDSSYDRNKPLTFRVGAGETLRGIEQGVLEMKIGGKRKLTIPPDMAMGSNAALIYEIELLKIE